MTAIPCFLFLLASIASQVSSSLVTAHFQNNRRLLFDNDGNQVDAYGSKINFFNGTYYLYGNSFSLTGSAAGIKAYSSADLTTWQYEGYIVLPSEPLCEQTGGCGRPHIIYNPISSQYILWANAGNPGYLVATSSSPTGPFTFLPSRALIDPQFNTLQPADFTVKTINGVGYIVFSALNFQYASAGSIWPPISQTLHIQQLTPDYLNTTGPSYPITSSANDLIDNEAESPDLFFRNALYYIQASNTCGYCNGSLALIYRSHSISGPWTRQIISGDSCGSQAEGILPLSSSSFSSSSNSTNSSNSSSPIPDTYIYHSTSVPGGPRTGFSGHFFQPLTFNDEDDGSVADLTCTPTFFSSSVTFNSGNSLSPPGTLSRATDFSPPNAIYTPICDSDEWILFQTWTSSKSGTLNSVGINIAGAGVQRTSLNLTVFRFEDLDGLVGPGERYEVLGMGSFEAGNHAGQVGFTFGVVNVESNVTVERGDRLGLRVEGGDFVGWCHLEYELGENDGGGEGGDGKGGMGKVLLQQGLGQNSWRGLDGKTSVIYVRGGKGLKFAATVV